MGKLQTVTFGTAHFKSRSHAMNYYAQFASCKLTNIDDVQGKIDRGEIYTTKPDTSHPDAISCHTDKSGRYHIVWRCTSIK